jgi:hypothetical protein
LLPLANFDFSEKCFKETVKMTQEKLLSSLKNRFELNTNRHPKLTWDAVEQRIVNQGKLIASLMYMESTGGEPDIVVFDSSDTNLYFVDCAVQSPKGRRSLCYDQTARLGRKKFPPLSSAVEEANQNGLTLLNEEQYRLLQTFGFLDTLSSSWLLTPESIRRLGGAIFGDSRYERVFVFHNGADSYYADRGFRAMLKI